MFNYEKYYLKDNPFPVTAVIDPYDPDPRVNGAIFQEEIFKKEIQDLRERTERGINLVYISGIEHDKGVGKSALLINHWRECQELPNSTSIYIKLEDKDKPRDISRKIIETWHNNEILWNAFQNLFIEYCEAEKNPMLQTSSVKYLFEKHPKLCANLPLTLYTQIRDADSIANQFAKNLQRKATINPNNLTPLFKKYLSEPLTYLEVLNSTKTDHVRVFEDLVKILNIRGCTRHYIFMNQFEDMIMGASKRGIGKLCLALKNVLIASSRKASFYVTLHPNSEMLLQIPEAKDLTGIAPLDTIHRVNVMVLDRKGDQAVTLAKTYLDYYRTEEPPYPTYPIEDNLVSLINYLQGGNIRGLLQQLHNCIEYGTMKELPEITLEYALEHPLDILGREVSSKQLDRFYSRFQVK